MSRTKVQISISELQDAIDQLEETKPFNSPHKLHEALAQTPWAKELGATPVMFYLRIKEVNIDPDNPVITMRVKPARRVKPREPGEQSEGRPVTTRRLKATGLSFPGLDLLVDTFRGRGIEITGVDQLITSSQKSISENRAIMLAWADIRDKLGIPKPVKKTAPVVEPITELPITVTEEMPDGSPVQPQTTVEVESVEPVFPEAVPVPMALVRSVVSRPTPIRSSVPPRQMPVG